MDTDNNERNIDLALTLHRTEDTAPQQQHHPAENSQLAAEELPHPAPDAAPAPAADRPRMPPRNEEATTRPARAPKRPRTASTAKATRPARNTDPKKFAEDAIEHRLDHWRARAQVVYTNGQQDATSLWSPEWANLVTLGKGISVFDGFDRTWFIPIDSDAPLPADKRNVVEALRQREEALLAAFEAKRDTLGPGLLSILEDEVEKTCQQQWDQNINNKNEAPMQWAEVKDNYTVTQMIRMAAKARLIDGRALLPGYYHVNILDLLTDGKLVARRVSMPRDVDLAGFRRRLDSWCPPDDESSRRVLETFQNRVEVILRHQSHPGKKKAQSLLTRIQKPTYTVGAPGSERGTWIFKLNAHDRYTIPPGKSPSEVWRWPELEDTSYRDILDGVALGKRPTVVRVTLEDSTATVVAGVRGAGTAAPVEAWRTGSVPGAAGNCGCDDREKNRGGERAREAADGGTGGSHKADRSTRGRKQLDLWRCGT
ncbi:hypothetical protein ACJZ2D_007338 [Fusarium nematophilum]